MTLANMGLVTRRKKKKRKTGDELGKGSQKSEEAEECNTQNTVHWQKNYLRINNRCTLENCYS